jgi:hypothetical protein
MSDWSFLPVPPSFHTRGRRKLIRARKKMARSDWMLRALQRWLLGSRAALGVAMESE